jgi:hypothetical protein
MNGMFPLGHITISGPALELLQQVGITPDSLLQRHVLGDWGDLIDSDKKSNELALEMGGRLLSAYNVSSGNTVWVTTEPDRSVTTIMLPGEN